MPKFSKSMKVQRWLFANLVIIAVALSGVYLIRAYNTPVNVFWSMLDNSLSTTSVTKHVFQSSTDQSLDRHTELIFGVQNVSRVIETRKQIDGVSDSTVTQEIIGTPETDYVRFPFIRTNATTVYGKQLDYSKVQGVWGRSENDSLSKKTPVQNFSQAILGTVPIGLLNRKDRKMLLDYMRDHNIYDVDYGNIGKSKENGQNVYIYHIQVNAKEYFSMLEQFAELTGIGKVNGLVPDHYEAVSPLSVEFAVAVNSRQLRKIHYIASNQDETYDSYGVTKLVNLPTVTVPISELENRIQSL